MKKHEYVKVIQELNHVTHHEYQHEQQQLQQQKHKHGIMVGQQQQPVNGLVMHEHKLIMDDVVVLNENH